MEEYCIPFPKLYKTTCFNNFLNRLEKKQQLNLIRKYVKQVDLYWKQDYFKT